MSVRQDYWQFCDLLVRNAGEETIPPFACMQVVGYESIRMDDGAVKIGFKVKKPDGNGKVYLITSPAEIAPGKPGDATNAYGMFVLYSGTLPSEAETNENGLKEWGPKSGSWAIDQDGKGFVIIGQDGGAPASEPGFPPVASTQRVRVVIVPQSGGYITIKGTTGSVTRSDATFTLNEPESVNGPVPSGTITVKNDPPINTPGGRTVYARYNVSVGDSDQTHWDTGDGGNWLLHDRGMAGWASGDRQVHDHDANGDPHWHATNPCTPPAEG